MGTSSKRCQTMRIIIAIVSLISSTPNIYIHIYMNLPRAIFSLATSAKSIKLSPILSPRTQPMKPSSSRVTLLAVARSRLAESKPPTLNWKYSVGGAGGRCGVKTSESQTNRYIYVIYSLAEHSITLSKTANSHRSIYYTIAFDNYKKTRTLLPLSGLLHGRFEYSSSSR